MNKGIFLSGSKNNELDSSVVKNFSSSLMDDMFFYILDMGKQFTN